MRYEAKFTGWKNVTMEDMVVAYRKAKADCFFENTFPTAIKFAKYEQDLYANLKSLLVKLQSKAGFKNDKELVGEFRLLPKKLSFNPKSKTDNGHVHFSSPDRTFTHLIANNTPSAEFRIVGDFPVESHIISALWINTVGHKLDAGLTDMCYGARLKRVRDDETLDKHAKRAFHISAVGSFTPYFQPYQKWRGDGLKAIRNELEKDKDVIAVSLDLKSYYHLIDPMVVASDALLIEIGVQLSDDEKDFNNEFASFLENWSKSAKKFAKKVVSDNQNINGGLVIGLTASRIISNVLLHKWDKLIRQEISPIHYGRYVDDMFLVLHDSGKINNSHDFMKFLHNRLGLVVTAEVANENNGIWQINLGKQLQCNSQIKLQAEKQKLFILQGQAGLDLLDSIEKEIYELSSEHRLMPSPDQLEDSTAAKVLSAAGSVGEHADTLRRADGLTIRRLSWSLQLRHVETLARDLPPNEWVKQRNEFYQFAHNHILRPDNLFAHFSYLPRLLGFAISMSEWQQAEQIVLGAFDSLKQLQNVVPTESKVTINGVNVTAGENLWRYVNGTLTWLFIDAATRYYDTSKLLAITHSPKEHRLAELFLNGILGELTTFDDILDFTFGMEDFHSHAPLVAKADLSKEPYKRILASKSASKLLGKHNNKNESRIIKLIQNSNLIDVEVLKRFLETTRASRLGNVEIGSRKGESIFPYLFPTRPLTPSEISELAPECIGLLQSDGKLSEGQPSSIWAKYTQAIRGVWVKPTLLATNQDQEQEKKRTTSNNYLRIGTNKNKKTIVALTNLKTSNEDWDSMACNKSNLSLERYSRISNLVNDTLKLDPKPDYVIFPELSIPISWINSISDRLLSAGISLVAGTEYRHFAGDQVISEACLTLVDNRLGFPASVVIWQPKLQPAPNEEKELISRFGKNWAYSKIKGKLKKPVYIHNDTHFGVMLCSELQNSKARIKFQGNVDALMVLSWNQDLDTFSSLIESSALDIHAYTILVNNRIYGDSRVRSPAKETYMRDLARVRGGDNDFVIAATLDIDSLRKFQSKAKRWSLESDKFKPVPEGFRLFANRKKSPPSK